MSAVLREQIIEASRRMNDIGLNQGTSGNISVRCNGGMLITPSGVPYETLAADDIVFVDDRGAANGKPSSEWRFHHDLYDAHADFAAVVHAHPTYATALAICGRGIPPVHYMVAAAGGRDIPCAAYQTFGTADLSASVVAAMSDRRACLIANHGMIAAASTLARAMWLAVEVETLARQYTTALQVGDPVELSDAEIDRVLTKFADYGAGA